MEVYSFRVRLHDPLDEADADRLYDAFDEEIGVETGPKGHWVGFEREGESFLESVLAAVAELLALGFEPVAIEDELVSIADIAERTGRSRQSVSMLVDGRRGRGDFPPAAAGNVRSPLWHWADVAAWFENDRPGADQRLKTIAAVNGALADRQLARERPQDLARIRQMIAS